MMAVRNVTARFCHCQVLSHQPGLEKAVLVLWAVAGCIEMIVFTVFNALLKLIALLWFGRRNNIKRHYLDWNELVLSFFQEGWSLLARGKTNGHEWQVPLRLQSPGSLPWLRSQGSWALPGAFNRQVGVSPPLLPENRRQKYLFCCLYCVLGLHFIFQVLFKRSVLCHESKLLVDLVRVFLQCCFTYF